MKPTLPTLALATCAISFFFFAMPTEAHAKKRAIGHGDGVANVTIEMLVSDMDTKAPIANAKITFFNVFETYALTEIQMRKEAGCEELSTPPTGTIATTGTDGKASMRCTVSYVQMQYDDGSTEDIIYPSGKLLLEHPRYLPHMLDMGTLFPEYDNKSALPPVNIVLREKSSRPSPPEKVTVAKTEFIVPEGEFRGKEALSKRFFNKPEERVFDGTEVTKENWRDKWRVFSDALLSKAKNANLDFRSLDTCLNALNYGHNLQTALRLAPLPLDPNPPGNATEAESKTYTEKVKAEIAARELAEKEREKNPGRYYNNSLAIIPVGAYLARNAKGDCWIIVCKWELMPEQNTEARTLGHIMVWAMDARTAKVIACATCD